MATETSERDDGPKIIRLDDKEYGNLRTASALTLTTIRFIWGYSLFGMGGGSRGWYLRWCEGFTKDGRFLPTYNTGTQHLVLPCERYNAKDFNRVNERCTKVLIPIVTDLLSQVNNPL